MGCTTKVRIWPWPNGKGNDLHVRWKADFESVRQQPEVNLAAPVGVLSLGQLCAQIFNCVPVARYAKSLLFPSMSCSGLPARASNLFHFFSVTGYRAPTRRTRAVCRRTPRARDGGAIGRRKEVGGILPVGEIDRCRVVVFVFRQQCLADGDRDRLHNIPL